MAAARAGDWGEAHHYLKGVIAGEGSWYQEQQEQQELIAPEGVVLYAFDDKAALVYARKWLSEQREIALPG